MELICPSCEARYQLPPGSIGEKGRQVSCMNCGHHWHAYPPLVLGRQGTTDPSPSSGITFQGPAGDVSIDRGPQSAAPAGHGAEQGAAPRPVEMAAPGPVEHQGRAASMDTSRSEQLAEIRQMLAEVQSEDRAAATQRGAETERTRVPESNRPSLLNPDSAAEQGAMRLAEERASAQHEALTAQDESDDDDDDLRRRIDKVGERGQSRQTDVKKIRRRHERRVKRKKAAEQAGSGAFLTGFLLIAVIAAIMTALYVLHPQIIARMPESEGAMLTYVSNIDALRVEVADLVGGIRDWVVEKLGDREA